MPPARQLAGWGHDATSQQPSCLRIPWASSCPGNQPRPPCGPGPGPNHQQASTSPGTQTQPPGSGHHHQKPLGHSLLSPTPHQGVGCHQPWDHRGSVQLCQAPMYSPVGHQSQDSLGPSPAQLWPAPTPEPKGPGARDWDLAPPTMGSVLILCPLGPQWVDTSSGPPHPTAKDPRTQFWTLDLTR